MAGGPVAGRGRKHLLIDADDTLWENNVYFERAFDEFCGFLAHSRLTSAQIRAALDEIEIVNNRLRGYGSLNFGRNLKECYEKLAERAIQPNDLERVMEFAERILNQPIELIPGVKNTLEYLSARHDLTVFTKGDPEEQKLKVDRSGLAIYFQHTAIVKEKDSTAYREIVEQRGLDPRITWMIGNSPKSDINPALRAGINAVFVPHRRTWHLERENVDSTAGERLLVIGQFQELERHF